MNLHKLGLLVSVLGAFLGFVSVAHAHVRTGPFTYMGVNYTLSDLTGDSSTPHVYSLLFDASGYSQHAGPLFPDSANIKAWDEKFTALTLFGAPVGSAWTFPIGSNNNGAFSGCGSSNGGFACAEASTKDLFDADSGPYSSTIQVTVASAASSSSVAARRHVGAAQENSLGAGEVYGITSVTAPIPEPKIYTMMLAGLGLMGFVARRRQLGSTG
jgi:hypothetical protein